MVKTADLVKVKVDLVKQESNKISLAVEVEPETVKETYNRVFKKVSNQVVIPGFRKGKAPRQMVEKFINMDSLRQETLETILPEAYAAAINEAKLDPITHPELEIVQFEQDQPLKFNAIIEVRPEVKLGEYKSVAVKAAKVTVSDEQLDEQLKRVQERHVQVKAIEDRPLQTGDMAIIDYDSTVDGSAEPERQQNFEAIIDEGHVYKGFAEHVLGMQEGETKEFDITFPGDYALERLQNKTVHYKVTLKAIKERLFPPIDDDLARTVGEFENLQALKDRIRENLQTQADEQQQANVQLAVIEKVVENATIDIPDTMIDREVKVLWHQAVDRLRQQGMEVPQAMYQLPKDEKALVNLKTEATKRIKTSLTLGAVARAESIALTGDEIAEEIAAFARENNMPEQVIRQQLERENRMPRLVDELLSLKVIGWLMDKAQVELTEAVAAGDAGDADTATKEKDQDKAESEEAGPVAESAEA